MTSPIAQCFEQLSRDGRTALVPYLMSGFPTRRRFLEVARAVQDEGPDLMEIGIPFSDPLADGPVIQAAGQRSLENGTDVARTLEDVACLQRRRPDIPILIMTYLNPVRAYGMTSFAKDSKKNGASGWIVPDRDLDEAGEVLGPASEHDVDVVPLLAPTTPEDRIDRVLKGAGGFVYLVSVTGVTGARKSLKLKLKEYASTVRRHTDLPLCVGFGISGAEQAATAARHADGVIVGSALLQPFLEKSYLKARVEMLRRLRSIRSGLRPR